jgi:recombination protein RecR
MFNYSPPLARLIEELRRLPGIGRKSAQRIVYFLLKSDKKIMADLAEALVRLREQIVYCSICNNITASDPCEICSDASRDRSKICVVEEPFNIYSIEKTGLFRGLYHVLLGNLSPIRGIGPEELKIAGLLQRVKDGHLEEIILAMSPTTEGNATIYYLIDLLRPFPVKVTRIAIGLPVGADLDYADQVTIARALEGRSEIKPAP